MSDIFKSEIDIDRFEGEHFQTENENTITIEHLYQAFKERLLKELVVYSDSERCLGKLINEEDLQDGF